MTTWYDRMADLNIEQAARALAGNWRTFRDFGWGGQPAENAEDYAIVYLSNRESDCLDQSNEAQIHKALASFMGSIDVDGAEVESQSHNHWAVGHVDGIVIRCLKDGQPTEAFKILYRLACQLNDYPVLDENDFSEREQTAADEAWRGCYSPDERIEYIRKYYNQFEFRSFADMLGCVRGKYFAGYASELLCR